jgi:DNA excision repair protein ERCC-3
LGEAEAGEELLPADEDDIRRGGKAAAARRTQGSMLTLSGAKGAYLEYSTGAKGVGKGFGSGGVSNKPVRPKNKIFRERDAMRRGK